MNGTVKWFDSKKGYGFINGDDGKDYFVHQSNIQMSGFRKLDECDIVDFEVGIGGNGKEQALNVNPVLTLQMIKQALRKKDDLYVKEINKGDCNEGYAVVDQNNVIQTGNNGMSFRDLARYAGFNVEEICA